MLLSAVILHKTSKATTAKILELAVAGNLRIIDESTGQGALSMKPKYRLEYLSDEGATENTREFLHAIFSAVLTPNEHRSLKSTDTKAVRRLTTLTQRVTKGATADGYRRKLPTAPLAMFAFAAFVTGALSLVFAIISLERAYGGALPVLFLILGPAAAFATGIALARVPLEPKGVALRDHLLGLKEYIRLAEADRLRYLQSPQGALRKRVDVDDRAQVVHLNEKLLPYAVLFGLEKEWAEELGRYYEEQGTEPSWYHRRGAFNAGVFAASVGAVSTSVSSSYSSSSGGSSGGASSGGGGGGGGACSARLPLNTLRVGTLWVGANRSRILDQERAERVVWGQQQVNLAVGAVDGDRARGRGTNFSRRERQALHRARHEAGLDEVTRQLLRCTVCGHHELALGTGERNWHRFDRGGSGIRSILDRRKHDRHSGVECEQNNAGLQGDEREQGCDATSAHPERANDQVQEGNDGPTGAGRVVEAAFPQLRPVALGEADREQQGEHGNHEVGKALVVGELKKGNLPGGGRRPHRHDREQPHGERLNADVLHRHRVRIHFGIPHTGPRRGWGLLGVLHGLHVTESDVAFLLRHSRCEGRGNVGGVRGLFRCCGFGGEAFGGNTHGLNPIEFGLGGLRGGLFCGLRGGGLRCGFLGGCTFGGDPGHLLLLRPLGGIPFSVYVHLAGIQRAVLLTKLAAREGGFDIGGVSHLCRQGLHVIGPRLAIPPAHLRRVGRVLVPTRWYQLKLRFGVHDPPNPRPTPPRSSD